MVKIYCIQDSNNLKYVGTTTRTLKQRFAEHKSKAKREIDDTCSSRKLDLESATIILLEECSKENCSEREQYYIDTIDCVNLQRANGAGRDKQKREKQRKLWDDKNKERRREYMKQYRADQKKKLNLTSS
jgi:hypothetical protein